MTKKKIFILAGGTATAWHLCSLIKKNFAGRFVLYVGDINERNLIPASTLCDKYYRLPPINDPVYYSYMLHLLEAEKINILVPLIDLDLAIFPNDNPDLLRIKILSTAPDTTTMEICKSKSRVSELLASKGIVVPKQFQADDIDPEKSYFVKPDFGFGSRGASVVRGKDINFSEKIIIQEILQNPEASVEIFKKDNFLSFISRERLEVKSGVCTKTRFFYDNELEEIIRHINDFLPLPLASCIQFMKNDNGEWCLTDLNMRLGAGTALSSAAGFGLASAFLSVLSDHNDYKNYLETVLDDQIVDRVYSEIKMPCRKLKEKRKNLVLDLDGTLLDSRRRHIVVLAECINKINHTTYTPDDFYDFVSYKSDGNTGLSYLKNKKIPNEEAIISRWMERIEYRKYLHLDHLYPNVLRDLKTMSEQYNLFLLTARANKLNAGWQITELGIGEYFCDIRVVKNTGNVGLHKYHALHSRPVDMVIGDTETDLALANYAQCRFFPLSYGFRSAKYWRKTGLKSYNSINKIISTQL